MSGSFRCGHPKTAENTYGTSNRSTRCRECDRRISREWKERNRDANLARDREYSARPENRGRCTDCGGLMGVNYHADGVCAACRNARHRALLAEIERLWNDGRTIPEIAAHFDRSQGWARLYISEARDAGYRLPYRHKRPSPKHPELAR